MNSSSGPINALTVERLYALRYLTVAGIVVFLYDFTLTFSDEWNFIWRPLVARYQRSGRGALRKGLPRPTLLYIISRYLMSIIGIMYLSDLIPSRNLTTNWVCQGSAVFIFSMDVIVEVLSCGVVLHKLFRLWQFNILISRIVLWAFSIAKVILFSFAGLAIALTKNDLSFVTIDNLRFCGVSGSSRFFLGVWITCVAFDVSAFVLLLLNALAKPRSESQRLLNILYKDGILFFLTIFVVRSLNLIISAVAPPSLIILGIVFSASMVSTIVSRSFLGLQEHAREEAMKTRLAEASFWDDGHNDGSTYAMSTAGRGAPSPMGGKVLSVESGT